MAEIEKEALGFSVICYLAGEFTLGGSTLFFLQIIYIVQLFKEDCTILRLCWAVGLSSHSTDQIVGNILEHVIKCVMF